ncbi:MAG TPA: OmpA family protein, partial [Planctomycetota bacterium]|nr:OmpA family protein [Planctomycetota bacterium]
ASAACVNPETHRAALAANNVLQGQIADLSDNIKKLSAENERLRGEVGDLSKRAADASWIEEQKAKINELLAKYGAGTPSAQAGVEFVKTDEGYAFRVAGGVLFAPGQNTLTEQGKSTLKELATKLATLKIRVEGHTDDTPIQRSQWGTNLRLSVERAMVVADFLIQTGGLKADRIGVAGYGEYRPAVPGTDDASRQKNRRVELLMLKR